MSNQQRKHGTPHRHGGGSRRHGASERHGGSTGHGGDGRERNPRRDEAKAHGGYEFELAHSLRRIFSIRSGRASYEAISKRIVDGAKIDGTHVWSLIAAMLIASIGLNIDSTEAIIGAMLICPIMGYVLSLSYAVATLDRRMLKRSMIVLATQILICFVTATLYFTISPLSGATAALASSSTPTIWDVLIAFIGGFAGSLGTSRKNSPTTLVSGVAVATSLMPPLCTTGYGLATGSFMTMASAFYEFALNVTFITFGSELVFVMLRLPLHYEDIDGDGMVTDEDKAGTARTAHRMRRRLTIGTIVFAIPCLFISANVVKKSVEDTGTVFEVIDQYDTERTTRALRSVCPVLADYSIGAEDSYDMANESMRKKVVATVETIRQLDDDEREQIESLIKINVKNVDEIHFQVTEDLDQFSGTERII